MSNNSDISLHPLIVVFSFLFIFFTCMFGIISWTAHSGVEHMAQKFTENNKIDHKSISCHSNFLDTSGVCTIDFNTSQLPIILKCETSQTSCYPISCVNMNPETKYFEACK